MELAAYVRKQEGLTCQDFLNFYPSSSQRRKFLLAITSCWCCWCMSVFDVMNLLQEVTASSLQDQATNNK